MPLSNREQFRSARTAEFTESVIREMSRLAMKHNAVNLAQGFPDFPAPVVDMGRGRCLLWLRTDVAKWAKSHRLG